MKIEDFPLAPSGKSGWPWTEVALSIVPPNGDEYPKITLVTPSFNQGEFIEETIRSVLLQNYPNLEYIIIDGGSTDDTVMIIKKYEKYISYWISEKDKGQSEAINKGLKIATGEIFNWLNSDDYYAPGTLKKIAELFSVPSMEVVCGKSIIFGKDYSFIGEQSMSFEVGENYVSRSRINQPATFFRMAVVRQLGYLNTEFHYCMDLEWWMKYLFTNGNSNIVFTDDCLVNFRQHEKSKTIDQASAFVENELILYSGILAKKNPSLKSIGCYVFDVDLSAVPSEFVFRLSNQFFFNNAVWNYGKRNMKKVRLLLTFVKEEFLSPTDLIIFKNMKFRSAFLPPLLFRIFGK